MNVYVGFLPEVLKIIGKYEKKMKIKIMDMAFMTSKQINKKHIKIYNSTSVTLKISL